jgi:KDO2-lipid IV(A) lauroyltransferase
MDAGGSGLQQQTGRASSTIYRRPPSDAVDRWLRAGRQRFGDMLLLERDEGVKPIVRSLRQGRALYLLPDMDFGPQESIFVPFFGVPAATLPSLPRFARLGGARVLSVVTRLTPQGYEVQVHPAWPGYPSGDLAADTRLMNERLEGYIRAEPEQYYWVHKRFKTRPAGEPPVY